jgi:outer membrane protein assembly factor BamB
MSDAGRLHIHSGRDGAELWSTNVPGASRTVGRPQVTKVDGSDLIIAPFGKGGVAAFDYSGRKLVWSAAESAGVTASPRVVDLDEDGLREVIVATLDGRMLVLDLATGKTLWSVRISDKMIEADPAVFSCDGDGVLDIVVADHDFQLTVVGGFAAKHIRRARAAP